MPPKQGQQQPPPPLAGDEEDECVTNKEVHAMMKAMTELFTMNQQSADIMDQDKLLSRWNAPLLESLIKLRLWRLDC
jgi:hypothetical protein